MDSKWPAWHGGDMSQLRQQLSRPAFAVLGLSEEEERVYHALTRARSATPGQLRDQLGGSAENMTWAIAGLESKGLVSWTTGSPRRLLAAPPAAAVDVLALEIERELQRARVAAARLAAEWSEVARVREADELVEIITGTDAMLRRFESMISSAQEEILGFAAAPIIAPDEVNLGINIEALNRDVTLRTIYERAVLGTPGFSEVIVQCEAAGEQIRIIDRVPSKMVLVDSDIALLPVHVDHLHAQPSAAVIHAPLTRTLTALFEELWRRATPASLSAAQPPEPGMPSGSDLRLLSLMLGGLTDDAIARQLGISRRTVQRRVLRLIAVAGAQTRLQLIWRAGERGWLSATGQ
ncbi:MAG TPA: hypothetical protein VGG35_19540 [Streptosporangiaceae bacterium]